MNFTNQKSFCIRRKMWCSYSWWIPSIVIAPVMKEDIVWYSHFLYDVWASNTFKNWRMTSMKILCDQSTHFHTTFSPLRPILWILGVPKKCIDFTMSYLQKYWILRLQIFYSNLAWVEIVYWKILCDRLNPFKLRRYLKISKFSTL